MLMLLKVSYYGNPHWCFYPITQLFLPITSILQTSHSVRLSDSICTESTKGDHIFLGLFHKQLLELWAHIVCAAGLHTKEFSHRMAFTVLQRRAKCCSLISTEMIFYSPFKEGTTAVFYIFKRRWMLIPILLCRLSWLSPHLNHSSPAHNRGGPTLLLNSRFLSQGSSFPADLNNACRYVLARK